jgi:uncharacterized repeat protein (TIGR03803 family)
MKRLCIAAIALTLLPVAADAATEQVLWSFDNNGSDGTSPEGDLISVKGALYGTTSAGGQYGYGFGTVFSLNPTTGKEKVLWSFGNGTDGQNPYAGLKYVKGTLYGTTYSGGQYNTCDGSSCGTAFSLDPISLTEKVQWSFGNGTDGQFPYANVIAVKKSLYGTTVYGGKYGTGTVFSFDPTSGKEKVLWSFGNGTDGYWPAAGLISVRGTLYATTYGGGQYGDGTVFSFDPKTGTEKVLWSFGNGTDGFEPYAALIAVKGKLYGTTQFGGQYRHGTIFSLDPATGTETVLWSFGNGNDGFKPASSMIFVNGTLFGTTVGGGQYGGGTVFSLDPETGMETVLWSFGNGTDGVGPEAGLISVKKTLYGTTFYGGQYGYGTVFSLTP